jgi:hypothetical protein
MSPVLSNRVRGWRGVARASRTAGRAGHELLRRRDIEILGWLAEQYGARADQLEVLVGAGPRTMQRTVTRLRAAGLVQTQRVLVDEPAWVLPTGAGMAACSSGFGIWRPRIGSLAHVAAVNDVRLHVQGRAPSTEWVPERVLARDRLAVSLRHLKTARSGVSSTSSSLAELVSTGPVRI